MSRLGQCPSCHTVYELDEDAIGHTIDCQCGAALFVCDVAGFGEIPVFCTACGGEFVIDHDGAGEVVECDCGEHLTVPTAVLRQPISSAGANAGGLLEESGKPGTDKQAIVQCPGCGKQYSVVGEDVGGQGECRCGCVFVIKTRPDGTVVAQVSSAAARSSDDEPEADEKPARQKKPVSLLSILGVAAVGLLLLVSIIMFVMRDRRRVASAKPDRSETVRIKSKSPTIARDDSERERQQPDSVGGSFGPPKMTPIGAPNRRTANDAIRPIPDPGPAPEAGSAKRVSSLLVPPPDPPLPDPKPARPMVPVIAAGSRGLTFERAYAEAFEAYEETSRLKQEADQSGDSKQYYQQLGETLGLLQQTLDLATRQSGNDKVDELRYLLAYLNFTAGRLAEAGIFGTAVARWGDPDDPATLEAAMIALAATQEANETGWGDAADVGELDQMQSIADVIAQRWPDNPQLDLIWMNLGQRYGAFGQSLRSGNAYARVPSSSPRYGTAQLAAGSGLWTQYRKDHAAGAEPSSDRQEKLLQRAEKLLSKGVETVSADTEKPTVAIISAKLSLARMAVFGGDLQKAESWLVDPPMSVVDSVVVSQPNESSVKVSDGFLRSVFETLFAIRTQRRDPAGAKAALEMMAGKVGGGAADFGKMFLSVATDYIDQLVSSPVVNREQFSTLSELIEPLKVHDSTLTVPNVLWLGESWSKLAERAATPELVRQCYIKAAAAYALAMKRPDFPPASRQAASIRRIELLRLADQLDDVIPLLESILTQSPNAIDVQIEAAETLQQIATAAGQPEQLVAAIEGPPDSPIWGWARLVTTLYGMGSSEDQGARNRDRLLKCQYNLAKCQWLVAQATSDDAQREKLLSDCRRSLQRLVATTSPDREPWYARLQELQREVGGEK